jgi:Fic family protein
MEQILEKIDRLKKEYDALLPMSPEFQSKLDKKFRLEFNFNSNHIEGNTLTYSETELLLLFDDTKGSHTLREYEEMKAHDAAFQLIRQWTQDDRPLVEADIKNLNKVLLVRPYWKDAITPDGQNTRRQILVGEYKQQPNSVRLPNGEMFEYASPIETPVKMQELVEWLSTQETNKTAHPLLLAALLHFHFVRIHPFDDGNGRVSRLLMNYVLFRHGFPPVIIKSVDKANYLRALNLADTGDTEAFVRYIGEQLVWSLELSIKAANGKSIEEPDDIDKELVLLQKQLSSQNTLQQQKTPENVMAAFEGGLIELFQLVETKLQTIVPSFFEVERGLTPELADLNGTYKIHDKSNTFNAKQNDDDWKSLMRWLKQGTGTPQNRIVGIHYSYNLKGLKSNINAPRFQANIHVKFNEYNYEILSKLYRYGQPLTQEEIQNIVRPIIKDLIEKIKVASQI